MDPHFAISPTLERFSETVVDCPCHGGATKLTCGWLNGLLLTEMMAQRSETDYQG
jgi:hypothetical protein